jgi:hypothetical protein
MAAPVKLAAALGAVLLVAAVVLFVVDLAEGVPTPNVVSDLTLLPVVISLGVLGPVIVRRRPGNVIGRIFCIDLLLAGTIMLADGYAARAAHLDTGRRPHDELGAWVSGFIWVPIVGTLLAVVPIRFPTGTAASPRWRLAERFVWVQVAILTVGLAFAPTTIQNYAVRNPVTPPPSGLFTGLMWTGYILIVPAIAVGAVAVAVRYRRARGIERKQLEWLAFGAGVAAFAFAIAFVFTVSGTDRAWNYAVPVALTCVVLATGTAVLRYRLYDVDRLITRTVSYGVLTIVLGATYVGLVLAGQALFSTFAGGSDLAVAASTLVVAGLFLPARTRVQRFVDRRFYRRRYDTRRTLESFGARLRREVDLVTLSAELRSVVDETMQPAHVSLWLREAP